MTYVESANLMADMVFKSRVKVACLNYANFIQGEDASVPGHRSRATWANNTFLNPDTVAGQVQQPVVTDPAIQSAGSAIDDAGLQRAVETTVNKLL